MKKLHVLILAALVGLFSVLRANTIVLSDNFSGPSLDTTKWATILPYGSSTVIQNNGQVTTTGRGILATKEGYDGPYILNGAFTMNNDLEHFNIVLRSDMSSTNSFEERTGLIVTFVNDGNGVSIQEYTNPMANWKQIASTGENGFSLLTGQTYFFSIFDTGTDISVWVNGAHLLDAATNYSTGNRIGFYSREFGSTSTSIDAINLVHVPEAGITALYLGLTCIVLGLINQSRKFSTL